MRFTKMHGIGNDYVYVDCTKTELQDPAEIAKFVSNRHFGIGSDGLILIKSSDVADFEMEMYNADGSRGKMCGNGIRCVGKYVYDHGMTDKTVVKIATGAGIKTLTLTVKDGKAEQIRVDMGGAILEASAIPTTLTDASGRTAILAPIEILGKEYRLTCVSMGNPHAVCFMENLSDVEELEIEKIGPHFENADVFPDRVNTEFVCVENAHSIRMRVWERGSGETEACGTGACATAVAGILPVRRWRYSGGRSILRKDDPDLSGSMVHVGRNVLNIRQIQGSACGKENTKLKLPTLLSFRLPE